VSEGARGFPAEALPFLRCPVCGTTFSSTGASLRCANGHIYDVAHQGYVNLLPGGARPGTADTAEMVAARESFLAAGHFARLRDFVCEVAERALAGGAGVVTTSGESTPVGGSRRPDGAVVAAPRGAGAAPGCVTEVGAGTGYYLAGVLDRLPGGVGLALDISKYAARRAARAHERVAAVVCDAWAELPIADDSISLVLDIFAPRNPPEFYRILRPDGVLLVVTPSPRHLRELVAPLGLVKVDERKPERLEQALRDSFALFERAEHEERRRLTPDEAEALAVMGPSAWHVPAARLAERLATLGNQVETTLSVVATTYLPRRGCKSPMVASH
jgi:23S rRNA (guanine745-N1)-methyltransferase